MSLESRFRIRERGSSLRLEVVGGTTTFLAMAYIVVVNPAILAFAGLPTGASTVATALAAALGTLLMALVANRPFAVAPYMGENAFVAFGLAALGLGWQQRLGAVFVAGVVFVVLTLAGIRSWLAAAISSSLKHAFAVGIGLFLALLGLYESGIVTSFVTGQPLSALATPGAPTLAAPPVPLKLGDLGEPTAWLSLFGLALAGVLLGRRVPGALLLSMATTAVLGVAVGAGHLPAHGFAIPFRGDYSLAPLVGQLDIAGILAPRHWPVLLTLLLMGFLDTLGTLVALGAAGKMLDERGDLPEIERPMLVDALASAAGAWLGTSTSGVYVESSTGIREGARTGFASLVTAAWFLAALPLLPVVTALQSMRFVYAPPLVLVGLLMMSAARGVEWSDLAEGLPAFLSVALTVFSYNIANGLAAGLAAAPFARLATGRGREISAGTWILAAAALAYFVWGLPH